MGAAQSQINGTSPFQSDSSPPPYDEGEYVGETVMVVNEDNDIRGEKVRHGKGTCTYRDGSSYEGEWRMGKKHGYGVYKTPTNSVRYEGRWREDLKHGEGRLERSTGERVEGKWVQDQLQGASKYRADAKSPFETVRWQNGYKFDQLEMAQSCKADGQMLNMFFTASALGCFAASFMGKEENKPCWQLTGGIFYSFQFIEAFTSNTWSLMNHVKTPQQAIQSLHKMKTTAPEIKLRIENYHYEEVKTEVKQPPAADGVPQKPKYTVERKKVVSGGQTKNLKCSQWMDLSDSIDFMSTLPQDKMTRIHLTKEVNRSDSAEANFEKIKKRMHEDNHTTRPHEMKRNARDVEHDWEVTETACQGYTDTILVANGATRPFYAKRRNYLLATLVGMSWWNRNQFMENTHFEMFAVSKQVDKMEEFNKL